MNKPIKIAIIGAQGSGKTTLINKIEKELISRNKLVKVIEEVARASPWSINESADFHDQRWIIHEQIRRELESEYKNPDIILCDRGIIDHICYMERIVDQTKPVPIIEFLQLHEIARYHSHKYDHIIYMPFNKKGLIDDGVRSTDEDFARDIDTRINSVINDFKLKNVIRHRSNFSMSRFCNKIAPKKKIKKVTKRGKS